MQYLNEEKTIVDQYNDGTQERHKFLQRARLAAYYTLSSLYVNPKRDDSSRERMIEAASSIGSQYLITLANKIHTALFNPRLKYFGLKFEEDLIAELGINPDDAQQQLNVRRDRLLDIIRTSGFTVKSYDHILRTLGTGNSILHIDYDINSREYLVQTIPLDRYVIKRDTRDRIRQIIIMEKLESIDDCPEAREALSRSESEDVIKYTEVWWEDGTYHSVDYINEVMIPSTRIDYPEKIMPYIVSPIFESDSEHYKDGYVENFFDSFEELDRLSDSLRDKADAAAWSRVGVAGNSVARIEDLKNTKNGDFVLASPTDIFPMTQQTSTSDFNIVLQRINDVTRTLAQSFLVFQPRESQRTTAQETIISANQIDANIANLYSRFAENLQKEVVRTFQWLAEEAGDLDTGESGIREFISEEILTGYAAIGNGQDLRDIQTALELSRIIDPQLQYYDTHDVLSKINRILGTEIIPRQNQEVQQAQQAAQQQAQQAQLAQQGGQEALSAAIQQQAQQQEA